ncbi:4468_t:CDS:2, partial [Acaulospora colombiana]
RCIPFYTDRSQLVHAEQQDLQSRRERISNEAARRGPVPDGVRPGVPVWQNTNTARKDQHDDPYRGAQCGEHLHEGGSKTPTPTQRFRDAFQRVQVRDQMNASPAPSTERLDRPPT